MPQCPCVISEWKTPCIHAVVVSDASSGTSPSPVRRTWPCGRSTPSSFARVTTCRCSPAKNDRTAPPSASSARRSPPKRPSSSSSARSTTSSGRPAVNNVPVGAVPAAPPADRGVASGSASVRSTSARSAGDDASGWSASTRTKKPRVATAPGASATGSSWITAIACSCCRRPGSAFSASPAGMPPARVARPCSASASVVQLVPRPSAPTIAHGWRPPMFRFCRTASTVPRAACASGVWSMYWLT